MVAVGDARERGHRLSLAPRAEGEHVSGRELGGLAGGDDRLLGDVDVAEVAGDVEVLAHRAPNDGDLAAALDRHVRGLLHAVDVRREAGHEDSSRTQGKERAKGLADEPLRAGRARPLGVRRVAEQEVDSPVSDLGERPDVGAEPVDRRVVELPVAGVHDPACASFDDERHRVRDRVRDADHLHPERPELERLVVRAGLDELRCLAEPVLVELGLDEREREARRDDRGDLDLAEEVRQASDVILVTVREDDCAHLSPFEVADVREEQVDPEMLVAREREPGVDDEQLARGLVDGHVLADLAEAAERDDPQGVAHPVESMRVRPTSMGRRDDVLECSLARFRLPAPPLRSRRTIVTHA